LRRSPGLASQDGRAIRGSRRPSRESQWPRAVSSLTVARQRGICTRFPVFVQRRRRALRVVSKSEPRIYWVTWPGVNLGGGFTPFLGSSATRLATGKVTRLWQTQKRNTRSLHSVHRSLRFPMHSGWDDSVGEVVERAHCAYFGLPSESSYYIEQKRKNDAQQDRGGEGEVERCVLTSVNDVSGKTADGKMGSAQEKNDSSSYDQDDAEDDEEPAEFRHKSFQFRMAPGESQGRRETRGLREAGHLAL
jgi:hypothetical protein